tara:strand:- start:422 stop:850 length:429 start_codon:yes stop_codon:yes gene_type:complete
MSGMTSSKPYLVRAFNEWIIDNNMTPYIVVNANVAGVKVPKNYVEDGRIILNIAMGATQGLLIDNSFIEFTASFGGKMQTILAPIKAIEAIYAKETGKGMIFSEDDDGGDLPPLDSKDKPFAKSSGDTSKSDKPKSHLRVIK